MKIINTETFCFKSFPDIGLESFKRIFLKFSAKTQIRKPRLFRSYSGGLSYMHSTHLDGLFLRKVGFEVFFHFRFVVGALTRTNFPGGMSTCTPMYRRKLQGIFFLENSLPNIFSYTSHARKTEKTLKMKSNCSEG